MNIIITADKSYPIKFDDSWGGGAYLYHSIVTDDKEWAEFIKELNETRKKVLDNLRQV